MLSPDQVHLCKWCVFFDLTFLTEAIFVGIPMINYDNVLVHERIRYKYITCLITLVLFVG